jgi:hypothetical protein
MTSGVGPRGAAPLEGSPAERSELHSERSSSTRPRSPLPRSPRPRSAALRATLGRKVRAGVLALLGGASVAGCGSSVGGSLTVEGELVDFAACSSLEPGGMQGVHLDLVDGRTVRLSRDGSQQIVNVGFFEAGADLGASLGPCARGRVVDTDRIVNRVRVLDGSADFDCSGFVQLRGQVEFSGCR